MIGMSSDMRMQPSPSRTAVITCLMRALHTKYDRPALIHDTWADRLVSAEERNDLAAVVLGAIEPSNRDHLLAVGGADVILHAAWRNRAVYGGVIIRTRYTEDTLKSAAQAGVRQYVIIGAGLDCFGVVPPEFARDVHVFEIDHPASQDLKRARLAVCGAALPPTIHFVPADLSKDELHAALARSPFRFDQPAILSWLGVTVYLTREANLATLRSIGNFAAAGSQLVFTYIEERALHSSSPIMERARAYAAAIGEPWISGFDSATLPIELRELGLEIIEDLGGQELRARYCADRTDGFTPGKAGRIALAKVARDDR